MKHPERENLEKYAARQLNSAAMTKMILHLENCAECFDIIQEITISFEPEETFLFGETGEKSFHLNYEEHLRPFVDLEADAATREIVESHTQNCSNCAFQLRELRQFSESLQFRKLHPANGSDGGKWAKYVRRIFAFTQGKAFRTAMLLILLTGGFTAVLYLLLDRDKKEGLALRAENVPQIAQNNEKIIPATNKIDSPVSSVEENRRGLIQGEINSINRAASNPTVQLPIQKLAAAEDIPSEFRAVVSNALLSKKLNFAPVLGLLRTSIKLRGEQTVESKNILYPNGEVIFEKTPRLVWKKSVLPGEKYTVSVFDEKNNAVAVSGVIETNYFQLEKPLQSSVIYSWEVKTVEIDAAQKSLSVNGKFQIIETEKLNRLKKISNRDPLRKAIVCASLGLLTEAEKYFLLALKDPRNASLAQKFLRQIRKK